MKLSAYQRTFVPLYHTACGVRISVVKNVDRSNLLDQVTRVTRHLVRQGYRCPRCKLPLFEAKDVVPSWDERDFIPVTRQDESGLVGFGPEFASLDAGQ